MQHLKQQKYSKLQSTMHSNGAGDVLLHIPIKFPSGLHATRLTDIDESLTKAAYKRPNVNLQDLVNDNE